MAATQRLPARAGERPVHHVRDDPRLPVRRCTGSSPTRSRCRSSTIPTTPLIAVRDRPQQGGRAVPDRAGRLPARRARRRRSGSPAAAPSTTTSRSGAAGWSTPTGPIPRRRARGSGATRCRRRPRPAGSSPAASRRVGTPSSRASRRERSPSAERPRRRPDTATSPTIALPATARQKLQFRWTFAHDATARSVDELRVEVIDIGDRHGDDGPRSPRARPSSGTRAGTSPRSTSSAWAGKTIRLRFSATDAGTNGIVEAGFDDVRVTQPQ